MSERVSSFLIAHQHIKGQIENKMFQGIFGGKLLEIHRNERCEAGSEFQSGSRYTKWARAKPEVGTWNLKKFGCGRV